MASLFCVLAACLTSQGAAPVITQQPQRQNVIVGDNATFQVVASGIDPLSYQWRFASTNLPGQTAATLLLSNVQSNQAGGYQVVVSDAGGSTTSVVASLTVRPPGTSIYLAPPGGWTYRYEGSAMATPGTAALDGTWNHVNGSDAWASDLRGAGNGPVGGLSVSNGVLTLEDVLPSGAGDDNRRLYFTHALSQDPVTNANTMLSDGVTFTFRTRLTPAPPTDPLTELTNAPNGFINVADGKGMIGMRQSGSSGMIISFSLNMAAEDTNATVLYDFPAAGLHMNNLNGDARTNRVDPGEAGTVNIFPANPADFHEFWITVQDNGADPGTHRASVYADGSTTPAIFNVTAGIGSDTPITNYLAIGLPSTFQRGAFDLDWVGYKQGVHIPAASDAIVEIVTQPADATVNEGQTATFSVDVIGTPPISFQWFRDGVSIPGATASSYTTGALLPPDNGTVFTVGCQNVSGSVTSAPAVLTVIGDNISPALLSAASLSGQTIGVCFSERVTAASAQNIANYIVNNGAVTVTSAILRTNANSTTVSLEVTGLGSTAGTTFTVRATNIIDASFAGNSGGGTVQGVVHGLTAGDIGIANGAAFTCASNRFEVSTGGAGLGGSADAFHFTSMARTGDFDVRVRMVRLDATNTAAQAGLVARVDLTAGSRSLNVFVTPLPGDNAYHATYRTTVNGATAPWPGGAGGTAPSQPWIRLMRAGDTFSAHHGTNGTNWQVYAQLTESLPATILVGIAGSGLADSVFDELIFIPPPEITTQPTSIVATNGDLVTFSVVATSRADIWYQWRSNGVDLLNQTNSTLVIPNMHPSHEGTYQVRVANGGGAVLSVPVTLTVRVLDYGDAIAAYPTLLANNGARHFLVPGVRMGAAADFELNGFPSAGASGDDLDGSDDEDGVTFVSPLWVDQTATIEVVASTNGVLNAWIDFGADGSFAQAEDHVFVDYGLEPGANLLSVTVPFDAKGTNTFARFRFSTVGGLSPDGVALDGEVEDYAVAVVPVADLSIAAVDSPDPVAVGSNLTFQVTIGNVGPAVATGVVVTNRFNSPVEFVSAISTRGACVNNAGIINCAIGDLGLGSNATITVVVKPQQAGSLSCAFGIYADQPDPNTGNNVAAGATTVELAPFITVPPASLTVTQHNTATFNVTVDGTAPFFYQWFHNSSPLANGTDPTLVIPDALSVNEGNYQVRITNRVGGTISQPVTLTVLDPPVIVQQPQSRTNLAGSTASFLVVADGTAPLRYQWLFNATNELTGETNAPLTLTNVQKAQAGVYSVRVMNSAGVVESAGAALTVIEMDFGDAPTPFATLLADNGARHRIVPGFFLGASVDFEPDGQANDGADEDGVSFASALLLGQNARIDVTVSSNGVLNAWVDWNGNGNWTDAGEQIFADRALTAGVNILNVTVPANAQVGSRPARFRFSSGTGLSFSGEALDGEVEDYQVAVQPAVDLQVIVVADPATVQLGSNVVYHIGVTNAGPSLASGVVVTSSLPASVTVLSLPPACTNQSGLVVCNLGSLAAGATNGFQISTRPNQTGMVTNLVTVSALEQDSDVTNNIVESLVSVLEFPAITSQPQSLTVTSGDAASFQATATGSALSYQWTFNGGDIAGATSSSYTINSAGPANEGTYRVRVSNGLGQVISDPAQLTVLIPPGITTQPSSLTVNAGENATFTVTATGTAPLQYQWLFGATEMPGETQATLSLTNVSAADEGAYRVRVSNAAGMAISDPAQLVVLVPVTITQQPQSKTVFAGANASLQVVATGTQPISYQWFKGVNALAGATSATLVISNVQVSHSGEYTVTVSNRVTATTSSPAQLTVQEADFGDADGPSYSTLLVFNAAYHYLMPGVFLGSAIDFEPDGQPAPNATGDDLAGQDDEDGVVFVSPLLVGQVGRVNVTASTNGLLDAWIDFNGNGDWTDSGEQIFVSRPLVAGNNALQFSIPVSALAHEALTRFRFSTAGGLLFGGGAPDGEVEDHVVTIAPAVDLSVSLIDQPDPALVGSNLHLLITVSNAGPSIASAVVLREQLPNLAAFLSATLSQGTYSNHAGVLICDLGVIAAFGSVTAEIDLMPQGIGVAAHRAEVSSPETDLNSNNNVAIQMTTVVTISGPFTNSEYIAINDFGPAAIYPSTITVSGVTGSVHQVIVTLHSLSHVYPDDLDLLLVGPQGQRVILMSDAGGGEDPAFTTFSFDDTSDLVVPDEQLIIDEPYRPSNYNGGDADTFNAPAPGGPYTNRLAVFKGTDANGVWSLYIMDDFAQDSGELAGGWSLTFYVLDPIADASIGMTASPTPAAVGQNVTYTLMVTNGGPSAVSYLLVTNVLPASAVLQSFNSSQGQCTNAAGEITCDLGVMEAGGTASLTILVTAPAAGVLSNYARITASQLDLNQTNNSAFLLTPVRYFADVSLAMSQSQDPVSVGEAFSYSLTVSNGGPQLASALTVTNQLPGNFAFSSATTSQGTCSNVSGVVSCELGDLAVGNIATIQITGQATRLGRMTNSASVQGNIVDGDLSNNQQTAEAVAVFTAPLMVNTAGITVPNPYPSTIQVSGLTGAIYKVVVIISNLNHPSPESLQLLLAGPSGQSALLLNAVGGNTAVASATLRLDDQAALALPDSTALASGTYRPTSYSVATSLPAPAPPAPYTSALAAFRDTDANGTWSLFTGGGGSIGAWGLQISTLEAIADVSVIIVSQPAAVAVGSNLTYIVTVSNRGPAVATGILLTNLLPESFGVTSGPGCTNVCNIGSLSAGSQAQIQIEGVALSEGLATNRASAFAAERDLSPANNAAALVTVMKTPPVISSQPQSLTVTNGDSATFTVGVTGAGPFTYQWFRDGNALSGATSATLVIPNAQQPDAGDYAVRVSDDVGSPLSAAARLTVLNRPTISDIGNITIPEDTASGELPFTINDLESSSLALEVASSDPTLIALSNVIISGSGSDRTVKVMPATNQSGVATITLTVRDGDGITASDSFTVNVTPVNDLPVLGAVPDQVMAEDAQLSILLQASDVEDTAAQLSLTALSSDSNLVSAVIVDRTLTLSGVLNRFGGARVTLILTDTAGGAVSNAFDVLVNPVNDPPTLAAILPVIIEEEAGLTTVPLSGISAGPANEPQTVTVGATTANTNLVANLTVNYSSGDSGSLSFQTVSNRTGSTTITVTVDDGGASNNIVTRIFAVSIGDVNDLPEISPIGDQLTREDTPLQITITITDEETPAELLTVAATSSNTNLVRDSNLTFSGTNGTRTLTISPESNASGSAFITVAVTDGHNATTTLSFQLQVAAVNDPPTLEVISVLNIVENSPTQVVPLQNITAGAPDEPHNLLITAASSNPALIPDPVLSYSNPNSTGTLSFTPQAGVGTAVITILVNDRGSSNNLVARTLTVNVSDQNSAPTIATIFNQTTPEDTPIDIPFTVFDSDSPADTLLISATSDNPALIADQTLIISGTGTNRSLRAVPALNGSGAATITLTATDTNGAAASATFVLNVSPVNDGPVIADIPDQQMSEDGALGPVFFYVNDLETAADALVFSALSSDPSLVPQSRIALAGVGTNRSIRIIPTLNRTGSAAITVTVRDAEGGTASDTFLLTVQSTNDPPVISAIANQTISSGLSAMVPFTINDQETDPDALSLAVSSSNPAVLANTNIVLSGSSVNRSLLLTPPANVTGTSTVAVVVTDAAGATASASFVVQVTSGSGPPVITLHPENLTVTNGGTATFSVTAAGAPTLRYRWRFNGTNLPGPISTNFTLVITNATAANAGPYLVTIGNSLASVTSVVAVLTVVNGGSTIPLLNNVPDQSTPEDVPLTLNLTLQDADTPGHFLFLSATSTNTDLIPLSNYLFDGSAFTRTLTIVPAPNQFGTNLITLTVSDGSTSSTDTFVLRVTAANDPPTLDGIDKVSALAGSVVSVPLTGISPGAPNETTTVNITAVHNNPAVLTNLTINYTPGATSGSLSVSVRSNAVGSATITVTAIDGGPATLRTFQIVVRPATNSNPVISGLTNVVTAEDTSTGPIPFTVDDPNGSPGQVSVAPVSSNTNVVSPSGIFISGTGANRTITLTPNTNQFGTTLITLTASDSASGLFSTNFTLTVQPVNDPPVILPITNRTLNEDILSAPIPVTIRDVETPASALVLSGSSSNPTLIPNGNLFFGGSGSNRVLLLRAVEGQLGSSVITVTVTDLDGAPVSTNFTATVVAFNDTPVISSVPDITIPVDSSTGPISFTVSDEETSPGNLSVSATAADTALVPPGSIGLTGGGTSRTLTIQPAAGRTGGSTITISASDGNTTATETFVLRVIRPDTNAPPTMDAPGEIFVNEDSGAVTVNLTGISPGANEPDQSVAISARSSNRDLIPDPTVTYTSPSSTGSLSLTPNPGTNGVVSITVTVHDGKDMLSRTFNVTVRARPVLSVIPDFAVDEDISSTAIPFTVSDVETPASNLVFVVASSNPAIVPPSNVIIGAVDTNRTLTVTGAPNQFGYSVLTLTVTDGHNLSRSNSFIVIVNPVNDQPTLAFIPALTLIEDQGSLTTNITGIGSGAANESQLLMLAIASSNPGVVPVPVWTYTSPNSTALLTFTPIPNAYGSATITVTVNDGQSTSQFASRSFEVTVNPVDDPPTLNAIGDVVLEHDAGPETISLSGISAGNVNEGQIVTVQAASSNPVLISNLTVSYTHPSSFGTLTLSHNAGVSGTATITVTVSDGPNSVGQSFLATVKPPPSQLAVGAIPSQTIPEDSVAGPIDFVIDDDGQPSVELSALSSNPGLITPGRITFGGSGTNRTITLAPLTNQFGNAIITVVARAGADSASNSFQLTVTGVDDFPFFIQRVPDSVVMDEDTSLEIPFSVDDFERQQTEVLVIGRTSYNISLFPPERVELFYGAGPERSIKLRPAPNQFGTALIELRVRDRIFQRTTNNFIVTVRPVEDVPTISPLPDQVVREDQAFEVGFFVEDVETDVSNLVVTASSSDTNLVANDVFEHINSGRTRLLRITPAPNRSGTNVITVTVRDEGDATSSRSFNLRVTAVNDPPTISAIAAASTSVGEPTAELPFVIADVETPANQLTLSARSSNTNLAPVSNIQFSGTDSNRTVRVTPAPGQTGLAVITVEVGDTNGAVAQSNFELVVNGTNGPPVAVLNPQDQLVTSGATVTFRVVATGPGPLGYQWQKDGVNLPGQNNQTLVLTSVQRPNRGAYRAVVNNANGTATSAAGNLEVFDAARILSITRTGSSAEIICESSSGQRYTLEYRDSLASGTWGPLETKDGTGSPLTFTDPAATPAIRLYRLRIE